MRPFLLSLISLSLIACSPPPDVGRIAQAVVAPGGAIVPRTLRGVLSAGQPVADVSWADLSAYAAALGARWALVGNDAEWCSKSTAAVSAFVARFATDNVLARGGIFLSVSDAGPETPGGAFGTCRYDPAVTYPATDDDLARWVSTFHIPFPALHDGFGDTPRWVLHTDYGQNHSPAVFDLQTGTFVVDTVDWMIAAGGPQTIDWIITKFETDFLTL
ncbi:MAG: hypothetical protein Q7S35_13775 [Candidatus Limnocylindrales bacterium]|nr:hypothetical protein [Candidatus Limnocylindrales bacterium]